MSATIETTCPDCGRTIRVRRDAESLECPWGDCGYVGELPWGGEEEVVELMEVMR